ncbi:MAG: hypothetical protein ACT4TC_26515, partial [Myxococcaceae bacterium]
SGVEPLSPDGGGICVPQKATVATAGQSCVEADPFKGAACANAATCFLGSDAAKCRLPCDLGCLPKTDGGTNPARCDTEENARCATGTSCTRVTSTTGVTLGLCL